jgi:hypothetical protein
MARVIKNVISMMDVTYEDGECTDRRRALLERLWMHESSRCSNSESMVVKNLLDVFFLMLAEVWKLKISRMCTLRLN